MTGKVMADHNIASGWMGVIKTDGEYSCVSIDLELTDGSAACKAFRGDVLTCLDQLPDSVKTKIAVLDLLPPNTKFGAPVQIIPGVGEHNTEVRRDGLKRIVVVRYSIHLSLEEVLLCEAVRMQNGGEAVRLWNGKLAIQESE